MTKYLFYLFFCLFVIYGCRQKPAEGIKLVSKAEFTALVDTISIKINAEQLGKYGSFKISDDNYLGGYNRFMYCLDFFSLDQRSFSHSVQLEKRGPNGISSVVDWHKIGDEYFIKSGYFLNRISKDGTIISKKAIKDLEVSKDGYMFFQKGPGIRNFDERSSDMKNFSIFQPIYKYQEDGSINLSSYFMCSIDVIHWTTNLIKVNFPELVVESFPKTGFLGDASMLRKDHVLVFNFPGGNEVYTYDTIRERLTIHDPIIINRNEMKIDIGDYGNDSFNASAYGQMYSPRYFGVKYDAKNNTYYRIHKTKARGESMFDADFFLIKMDSNFNTLVQYNLGRLFNPKFQIHNGDLYFTSSSVDKDALYHLKLYRIKG